MNSYNFVNLFNFTFLINMTDNRRILVLFDIDGTLTPSRLKASPEMLETLNDLRKKCVIGIVGGSDLPKQKDQLGDNVLDIVDYSFSENGLVAFHGKEKIGETSMRQYFSVSQMNRLASWILRYIADLDIPVKTGTFLESRTGMINVSPVGRNCTQKERLDFSDYDQKHEIRKKMCADLAEEFKDMDIQFSIGGQISIDIFPRGWTKSYCLKYVDGKYDEIHFFGDMTMEGGNDYEIFNDERVIGHTVKNPEDTIIQVKKLFLS